MVKTEWRRPGWVVEAWFPAFAGALLLCPTAVNTVKLAWIPLLTLQMNLDSGV